jgi:hypothetical protein
MTDRVHHGLADSESDVDRRGIYLPPANVHWSLYGVPEQLENHETQEAYWERNGRQFEARDGGGGQCG